jgi:hypothetical protein
MGERFKPAVLKTVDGETRPGVRIPLPPPLQLWWRVLDAGASGGSGSHQDLNLSVSPTALEAAAAVT